MKKSFSVLLASFFLTGVLLCTAISTSIPIPIMGMSHTLCSQTINGSSSTGLDQMMHWQDLLSALPIYFTLLIFAFVIVRTVSWMLRKSFWSKISFQHQPDSYRPCCMLTSVSIPIVTTPNIPSVLRKYDIASAFLCSISKSTGW